MKSARYSEFPLFLSTPSARRATCEVRPVLRISVISIHALREEGDLYLGMASPPFLISIHALREEGDQHSAGAWTGTDAFLSTPSARRATGVRRVRAGQNGDFYPRPPRGGRPSSVERQDVLVLISIHALREEGDYLPGAAREGATPISIHALREEGDSRQLWMALPSMISIHALREEGDVLPPGNLHGHRLYFYPRPPRGGRQLLDSEVADHWEFLSTPSARRATAIAPCTTSAPKISIHALREEGDVAREWIPAPPDISIHALREEGDVRR